MNIVDAEDAVAALLHLDIVVIVKMNFGKKEKEPWVGVKCVVDMLVRV